MATTDYQNLQELVEVADTAIRAANELRLVQAGESVTDFEALDAAVDFLDRAKSGGAFIAAEQSANLQFEGTLKPLNWATDTYLSTTAQELDYGALAEYLEKLKDIIGAVRRDPNQVGTSLGSPIHFFDTLGRILRARVVKRMRSEFDESEVGALP